MRTWFVGLFGVFAIVGCQFIGGLDELRLATDAGNGGGGSGGGGGSAVTSSSSSSSSSSSGAPIMGDILCGTSVCPVGTNSACCSDHYKTNSEPWEECIMGPPETDPCNTSGGTKGYETRIECQLPTHCPSDTVCCGNIDNVAGVATWYATLSCAATCAWPNTVICDPLNPADTCPVISSGGNMVQTTCKEDPLLPTGYGACTLP